MKDYDAIAREIYRDEAISRMLYYDQQEDQCVELIAAILRKHDEAEAGGELGIADLDIIDRYINDASPLPDRPAPYWDASDAMDRLRALLAREAPKEQS